MKLTLKIKMSSRHGLVPMTVVSIVSTQRPHATIEFGLSPDIVLKEQHYENI